MPLTRLRGEYLDIFASILRLPCTGLLPSSCTSSRGSGADAVRANRHALCGQIEDEADRRSRGPDLRKQTFRGAAEIVSYVPKTENE
jgi:hypothetical protein